MFRPMRWRRQLFERIKSETRLDAAGRLEHVSQPQSDQVSLPTVGALGDIEETCYATVLFVDLRGYCALCERLPAGRLVPLLKDFFRILVRACEHNAGLIYHVAGDGLMAAFGIRTPSAGGAQSGLSAAREMLEDFTPIADGWNERLSLQTGMGIGLNSGEVAFLNLDDLPDPHASTLIGDTVNVAARLCARARAGEILFSDSVAQGLNTAGSHAASASKPPPGWSRLANVYLQGRSTPVDVWCVAALTRVNFRGDARELPDVVN
jgi:adenylate cyclase